MMQLALLQPSNRPRKPPSEYAECRLASWQNSDASGSPAKVCSDASDASESQRQGKSSPDAAEAQVIARVTWAQQRRRKTSPGCPADHLHTHLSKLLSQASRMADCAVAHGDIRRASRHVVIQRHLEAFMGRRR
jgi:hypothetical protein